MTSSLCNYKVMLSLTSYWSTSPLDRVKPGRKYYAAYVGGLLFSETALLIGSRRKPEPPNLRGVGSPVFPVARRLDLLDVLVLGNPD